MRDAVVISGLNMAYGKGKNRLVALKSLSAAFPAGIISGLVGPDASGKTTLLRILAGLLAPVSGSALVFGKSADQQTGQTGYMPQHFGLYEDLSVAANLALQARLRGLEGEARASRFAQLLKFTGLAPFMDRLAGNLSGGMKQKLGIACALMGSPSLLLLDEPGVGVDPVSRAELWNMVQELKAGGMTIIWSTSYMDEAQKFPHILMLEAGSSLYEGEPGRLMETATGRVFLVPEISGGGMAHRRALLNWSAKDGVADALIEGSSLRLALAEHAPDNLYREVREAGGKPVSPTLEDAYMNLAGGISHEQSPFTAFFAKKGSKRQEKGGSSVKIRAENLCRKFGDFTAASGISLSVEAGMVFGLLGPNGAGKSTTFKMLCGLLRPTSGSCYVDGVNLLHSSGEARARLGYMAQKFSLYTDITVAANINCWASLYGMTKQEIREVVTDLVPGLGLSEWLRAKTGDLPQGLKQRLSLLCAAMHAPAVLFLDEPTSGVDVRTRRDFWKHISALTAIGTAIMVTTHFMEEAEYCDEIALLYRGSIINRGSPDALKKMVSGMANPALEDAFMASIKNYDRKHPL